jgi:glycosyltransferase involved in cell wall biosynthesis
MSNVSVSVLITAYNAEKFLDTALTGVSWQSVQIHEVVIVDDCSTDNTQNIIDSWSKKLPIRYIRNEINLGCGASRDVGLENITSQFVALLDADDIWLPDHLLILLENILSNRTVVSPRAALWPDGRGLSFDQKYARDAPAPKLQFTELCRDNFVFSGSLFSMEMVREVGGFPAARVGDDYIFWLKAVAAGFQIVKPKEVTVLYRRQNGSLSSINAAMFHELRSSIAIHLFDFDLTKQIRIKKLLKNLQMRELLCLYDEAENKGLGTVSRQLLQVVLQGTPRLKVSAIVRILRIRRSTKKPENHGAGASDNG